MKMQNKLIQLISLINPYFKSFLPNFDIMLDIGNKKLTVALQRI